MAGIQQLLLAAKPAIVSDPNFEYTTLLLPGNGTNGAQNNTFLDSSTNNFTITRNGNTTQGTFSPFSQTGWGNFFDGTGDYLTIANNVALQPGGGAFTYEAWVYCLSYPSGGNFESLWAQRATSSGYGGPLVVFNSSGTLLYYISNAAATNWQITGSSSGLTLSLNQWNHVAIVRNVNTCTIYLNGTAGTSVTLTENVGVSGNLSLMAGAADGAQAVDGYMSNFRMVKGTAVYTANFTPSTTPLTAISGTSLLTCQSNRFVDNSSNAFTITRNGDVSVQAFSPFNPTAAWSAATYGGSGYFDGSGDYLTYPSNAVMNFGTGDFTVEAWVYPTATPGDGGGPIAGPSGDLLLGYQAAAASWSFGRNFIAWDINFNQAPILNAWQHLAVCRSGTTLRLFFNGALVNSATNTNSYNATSSGFIGTNNAGGFLTGYMTSLRAVKAAVYTAAFTPPTAPLTAISNTQLLLNYTNAGIYDATSKNNLETVGNAQISTAQSKFGGSSMLFDGSGDWLKLSNNTAAQAQGFGTGDFTIECWVYITSSAVANNGIYDCRYSASATGPLIYYIPTSGLFMFYNGSNQISGGTITINTWNHIALVRYSGVTKLYINGTQSGSNYTDTNNYTSGANSGAVGAFYDGTSGWNGYIDDLRVTRGIARYTSNFIPPTTAFLTL